MASEPLESRVRTAAATAGKQADEVQRLPFDLSVIAEEGVFVNVDARGFGILDRKLDWTTLGVNIPKSAVAFRAPSAGLLPDTHRLALLRPSDQAHAALKKYSYHFSLTETLFESPAYRWIPWRAFEQFETDFQAAQAELDDARAKVIENYNTIVVEVGMAYRALAMDSLIRLRSTGADVPDNFADLVVAGMLKAIPTPDELREKLVLRWRIGVMMLGSEMLAEQQKAVATKNLLSIEDEKLALARLVERERAQTEVARYRSQQATLFAEAEAIERAVVTAQEDAAREARVKDRLQNLKIEAAKERLQESLNPMLEGAQQLKVAVYDAAKSIKEALEKNDHLPSASAKRAREIAKWYRLMNWQSASDLDQLIGELEALASRPPTRKKRDPQPIADVLDSIISACYADARAFGEAKRLGAIEL